MRTNIDIDDALMAEAMAAGGFTTKRETVEAGLRMLAQRRKAYAAALALGGKIDWQGDLDAWRRDKPRLAGDAEAGLRVAEAAPAYKPGVSRPLKAAKRREASEAAKAVKGGRTARLGRTGR